MILTTATDEAVLNRFFASNLILQNTSHRLYTVHVFPSRCFVGRRDTNHNAPEVTKSYKDDSATAVRSL